MEIHFNHTGNAVKAGQNIPVKPRNGDDGQRQAALVAHFIIRLFFKLFMEKKKTEQNEKMAGKQTLIPKKKKQCWREELTYILITSCPGCRWRLRFFQQQDVLTWLPCMVKPELNNVKKLWALLIYASS